MYLKRMILAGSAVVAGGLLIAAGAGICLTVNLQLPGVERLAEYAITAPYWVTYSAFFSAGFPLVLFGTKAYEQLSRARNIALSSKENQKHFKSIY